MSLILALVTCSSFYESLATGHGSLLCLTWARGKGVRISGQKNECLTNKNCRLKCAYHISKIVFNEESSTRTGQKIQTLQWDVILFQILLQSSSTEATFVSNFLSFQSQSFSLYSNLYTHKHIPPLKIDAFLNKPPLNWLIRLTNTLHPSCEAHYEYLQHPHDSFYQVSYKVTKSQLYLF